MIVEKSLTKVVILAVSALLLAALFSEFVTFPSLGHRVDIEKLPPEAQLILNEHPGEPISAEQWKRLDKVMSSSVGWPSSLDIFWSSVRSSWYWFLLFPVLGLVVLYLRWKEVSLLHAVVVFAPSISFLLLAFAIGSATLKG
jgi:hypothetical protein